MSKPETLWDLCELTAEAIETRPLNYCQNFWAHDAKECLEDVNEDLAEEACGTAFCRAGWMYAFLHEDVVTVEEWENQEIYHKMRALLESAGIPTTAIVPLFSGENGRDGHENHPYHPNLSKLQRGTKEYAQIGADGMRKFMQQYEKELKSAKL